MVNATSRPLYPRERDPVPIVKEGMWAPGRPGRVRKISRTPGFDPWIAQPVTSRYTDCAIPDHVEALKLIQILIILVPGCKAVQEWR